MTNLAGGSTGNTRNRDAAREALEAYSPDWVDLSTYRSLESGVGTDPRLRDRWPAADELAERLLAIDTVSHALPGVLHVPGCPPVAMIEHLLQSLVGFLASDPLPPLVAESALVEFLVAWRPRLGASDAVGYVASALKPESLRRALVALSGSESMRSLTRDLVRECEASFDREWDWN